MRREVHVRFCERLSVRLRGPTLPFQPRRSKNRKGKFFINFSPAVTNNAAKTIRDTFRSWNLPKRSDKAIEDLSRMFNPYPGMAPVLRAILSLGALPDDARTGP